MELVFGRSKKYTLHFNKLAKIVRQMQVCQIMDYAKAFVFETKWFLFSSNLNILILSSNHIYSGCKNSL